MKKEKAELEFTQHVPPVLKISSACFKRATIKCICHDRICEAYGKKLQKDLAVFDCSVKNQS